MLILAFAYILIPQLKFLTDFFLRIEGGVSNRDLVWNAAIDLFRENYIFGIGTNAFHHIAEYKLPLIYYTSVLPILHNSHNYLIEMAVQLGLPGLFIMLYIFYKFMKESIKCQLKSDDIRIKALSTGISAVMFAVIARGMFEAIGIVNNGLLFPEIYFWIIMMYPIKVLSNEHKKGAEYIW
jgi:O-antigen ligase